MIDQLSWTSIAPEILLLVMTCGIALVDLFVTTPKRTLTYVLSLSTLAAVAVLTGFAAQVPESIYGFGHMVVSDTMGNWLKCFAALAVAVTMVYSRTYAHDRDMLRGGELFTLSLFSLLGMFIMISGANFLVLYLGLELLTLSSYALVALRRDNGNATEAAMKYFVLGALASGFLLYGLSMLYGATGSLDIAHVRESVAGDHANRTVLVFGLVFIVAGLAFKLGAVPFHMWVPDVYQGAPTAVTLLIGAAPKIAAFGLVIRLLIEGLLPLAIEWQPMLAILAILSMAVGNLAAIMQTNIKRMLAFSTISQMGFVLLGLMSGVVAGSSGNLPEAGANAYSSSMFYVLSYVLTTLASFGIILSLATRGFESEEIADFAGLNRVSPMHAGLMAISMFSLAGIPPLVGFYAKLSVLQALISTGSTMNLVLAVFAVMMSLVGAFYYLRVVKVMYFDAPITATGGDVAIDVKTVLVINSALVLLLGIFPEPLMRVCSTAIVHMMGS
jgi:NADH-quinone oxidoreductase subunit N